MNPTGATPSSVSMAPLHSIKEGQPLSEKEAIPDLFVLTLHFGSSGYREIPWTHVPRELQAAILENDVKHIFHEEITVGGLASRRLPGNPAHVVLGVVTKAGDRKIAVPLQFKRLRAALGIAGAALCAVGVGLLWAGCLPVIAAGSLLLGSDLLRSAMEVPHAQRVADMFIPH